MGFMAGAAKFIYLIVFVYHIGLGSSDILIIGMASTGTMTFSAANLGFAVDRR